MTDLNSNMFYKAKFILSCPNKSCDPLWKLVLHIRNWQTEKWNRNDFVLDAALPVWSRLKIGNRIFSKDSNNTVYIESEYFSLNGTEEYWACKIVEQRPPKQGICPRQWVTEIGFERTAMTESVFSCVLTYSDVPGFFGPCEEAPTPTLPKLIRMLIEDESIVCTSGKDIISAKAQRLSPGSFPAFWESLIGGEREMPYIYISPKREERDSPNVTLPIEPDALAEAVCGNALVFYADSLDFSREMNYLCDDRYTCYSGRLKIYMPQINVKDADDQYKHRYLPLSYISDIGADETIKMLRRALAQNVKFYESFFRINDCKKKKEDLLRQKRLSEMRNQYKQQLSDISDQKLEEAIEEEQKRLEAESNVENLLNEISQCETENYKLISKIESMKFAFERNDELEKALLYRLSFGEYPSDPNAIVDYFALTFADMIAFTDNARRSLKNCDISILELWRTLFCLATVMRELLLNSISDPYQEFKIRTGIDCARGEGKMTRKDKKLMEQFEDKYDDRPICIEPHITFAREGQSIHFGFDDVSQKVIVGHCGEHLEIYSSRKQR